MFYPRSVMFPLLLTVCLVLVPLRAAGESVRFSSSEVFRVEPWVEGRVAFWQSIFTKYGEHHAVFHHREHPEIVYSVLDFRQDAERYSGRTLVRHRRKEVKKETRRIAKVLGQLASGVKPRSDFARKVVRLFSERGIASKKHYRYAADKKQIRVQTGIRERFGGGIKRSTRYLYAIEEIFQSTGIPVELALLPLVESSFDYRAHSSAGAVGIWQFTRSTGRRFMRINRAIDERRDPIFAARAAARYMASAHSKLHSWPLALTSYNHGLSGILRAVKQTGTRDLEIIIRRYKSKTFGFASSNFYPEFLAALEVERQWQRYFPEITPDKPIYFDEVRLSRSESFKDLLRATKLNKEDFLKLNPAILKPVIKGRRRLPSGSTVKVPSGSGPRFAGSLGQGKTMTLAAGTKEYFSRDLAKNVNYSGKYKVRKGDTISGLARRFGVSQSELMAVNGLRSARGLRAGKIIRIPSRGGKVKKSSRSYAIVSSGKYKVRSGDTISGIAKRFSVSQSDLMAINKLKSAKGLRAGKTIKIPQKSVKRSAKTRTYVVKKGDNLTKIAEKFGVSVSSLKKLNSGARSKIYPGQKLRIP